MHRPQKRIGPTQKNRTQYPFSDPHTPGAGGGGGGGDTLIFSWIRIVVGSFFFFWGGGGGVQTFGFQYFFGFRQMNIFGGMKILWIFLRSSQN